MLKNSLEITALLHVSTNAQVELLVTHQSKYL